MGEEEGTMLILDAEGLRGSERDFAEFWTRAHSVESALDGWQLALWCGSKPRWVARRPSVPPEPPLAAFGWPRLGRERNWVVVSVRDTLEHPGYIPSASHVALARATLDRSVFDVLKRLLGYESAIEGQHEGWWFAQDEVRPSEPPYRPTGALLAPQGAELDSGASCLVLVDVDDWWAVLSERALGTYTFGSRLQSHESVVFMRRGLLDCWEARLGDAVPAEEVGTRFGMKAAQRARKDAASVTVVITRLAA